MPNWRKGYQGPQRKYRSVRMRRARARNVLRRAVRRRRRYRKRVPYRSLVKSVKNLYKRDDKKFTYTAVNNLLVAGGPALGQAFQGIFDLTQIPFSGQTDPTTGQPYLGYQAREPDSVKCNLRNIRIHMTIHASHPEAYSTQKCYIALVKTRNGVGSGLGIQCPLMTNIWDYSSLLGGGNLLAPWELYRNTQGPGSELLNPETFKILKQWSIYLQPQHGLTGVSERTTGNDSATGTIVSAPEPAIPNPPANFTYTKSRPSEVLIKYTHKCLGAKLTFNNTTSSSSTNVKYFLVMCGNGSATNRGFRCNAICKVNFIDE